jgi:hypothetical protein
MEYKITNKVNRFLHGAQMNTVLIYTEMGQLVHIIKEYDTSKNWHKKVVSIGIADADSPEKITKATFESRDKLEQVIKLLENGLGHFD